MQDNYYEVIHSLYNSRQRFGTNSKNLFFCMILNQISVFFSFSAKTLKMTISTSVWGVQHPNAGRNIQHLFVKKFIFDETLANCVAGLIRPLP